MVDDPEVEYVFKRGVGWVAQQKVAIDWSSVYVDSIWDPLNQKYIHSKPYVLDALGNRIPLP